MLIEAKSFDRMIKESDALAKHTDSACVLGLARLP